MALISSSPVFGPNVPDMSTNAHARDIFSLSSDVGPSGNAESVQKGQLPPHFKVVGIVIAHPSQIIIEDTFAKQTYFIGEDTPQAGIKIVRADRNEMVINYGDQDIVVPVRKS